MSFCDDKLLKLNERMERPLPFYRKNQIIRTRVINPENPDPRVSSLISETMITPLQQNSSDIGSQEKRFWNPKSMGSDSNQLNLIRSQTANLMEIEVESKNLKVLKPAEILTENKSINQSQIMNREQNVEMKENEMRFDDQLRRKDSTHDRLTLENLKRIKESNNFDSSSNFLLINQGLEQNNKITDYFKSNANQDETSKKVFDNLTSFSQANFLIKNEPIKTCESQPIGKWEMILLEKEKEIVALKRMVKNKEDQQASFKEKTKNLVAKLILETEEMRRSEKKKFICEEKLRLGEFITYRDGAHLKEVWVNGIEIRMLKDELQKILEQKEVIENLKKKLKKKVGKNTITDEKATNITNSNVEKNGQFNGSAITSGLSNYYINPTNSSYLMPISKTNLGLTGTKDSKMINSLYKSGTNNNNPEYSDSSNTFSLINEKNLEENRERLYSRILILSKEENYLKEKIDTVERQKDNYIRISKQLFEEENCRFGKISSNLEERWPLLKSRYQIFTLIGKGGFSEVYKAFDCEELISVACKIHQLSPSWSENFKSNYIKHALRENQVHKNLVHPNIVSHFDSVEIDSNSFCAVLEYCNGPDLATYLKKYKTIPEKDAKSITRQILSGLKFLNETSKKIIHYDLKPQNILFHDGLVKISDFGLCKVMNEDETRLELTSQGVGTYWYLPPECFYNNYPKISTKVDVWSVGVILYELLYGIKPFGNDMCQEKILKEGIMLRAYTLDFPPKPSVTSELKDLIRKCLEYNQEERPDVLEVWNLMNKI